MNQLKTAGVFLTVLGLTLPAYAQSSGPRFPDAAYNPDRNHFVMVQKNVVSDTSSSFSLRAFDQDELQVSTVPLQSFGGNATSRPGIAYATGQSYLLAAWLVEDALNANDGVWTALINAKDYSVSNVGKIAILDTPASDSRDVRVTWVNHAQRFLVTWTDQTFKIEGIKLTSSGVPDGGVVAILNATSGTGSGHHVIAYNEGDADFLAGVFSGSSSMKFGKWGWDAAETNVSAAASVGNENTIALAFDPQSSKYVRVNYAGTDFVATTFNVGGASVSQFFDTPSISGVTDIVDTKDSGQFFAGFAETPGSAVGYWINSTDGDESGQQKISLVTTSQADHIAVAVNPECGRQFLAAGYPSAGATYVIGYDQAGPSCVTRLESSVGGLDFATEAGPNDQTKPIIVTAKLGNVEMGQLMITGGNDKQFFSLANDGCSGKTLQHNDTCFVYVRFSASTGGIREATLLLNSDASAGTKSVTLHGEAAGAATVINLYTPFDRSSAIRVDTPLIWLAPKNAPEGLGYRVTACLDPAMRSGCQVSSSYIQGK